MCFIREADLTGQFLADIPITNNIKMDKDNKHGFRNNLALEGSTFSTDGQSIWTSMEGSLLQDGQISTTRSGSFSRITQYNRNGELISEYAYPLDAVPGNPGANKTSYLHQDYQVQHREGMHILILTHHYDYIE